MSFPRNSFTGWPALAGLVLLAAGWATPIQAQRVAGDDDWCYRSGDRWDREWVCEVREFEVDANRRLRIDGRTNGGISVTGWDENRILVRARVVAWADRASDAEEIHAGIEIRLDPAIRADGPRTRRREGWSVSYEAFVPHETDLMLETTNGGITINNVKGDLDFDAVNGGIHLAELGGDVRGRTTNGGVRVELAGRTWEGRGLDVESTNGGVTLEIPEGYSADLETGTTNGGLSFDFPITVQGRISRRLNARLGDGGPLIRVMTTNGGVRVRRR